MRSRAGFTLIETIGALLIFTVALGMVIQLSGALGRQLENAAVSSQLVVLAEARLDSLRAVPFEALQAGTDLDTMSVLGRGYEREWTITEQSPLVVRIDVEVRPTEGELGPRYALQSYVAGGW